MISKTEPVQTPAHLFGPAAPHIAFWYGGRYLGEVRGHPAAIDAARWSLQQQIELLEPGPDGIAKVSMLNNGARAQLYCGDISENLGRQH